MGTEANFKHKSISQYYFVTVCLVLHQWNMFHETVL